MDKKPLGQSHNRKKISFSHRSAFENKYQELTDRDWLYKQFRCNMSHLATTGGFIILATRKIIGAHLEVIEGQRLFVVENLVEDFHKACQTLILRLGKGEIKQKQMAMNEISL